MKNNNLNWPKFSFEELDIYSEVREKLVYISTKILAYVKTHYPQLLLFGEHSLWLDVDVHVDEHEFRIYYTDKDDPKHPAVFIIPLEVLYEERCEEWLKNEFKEYHQ